VRDYWERIRASRHLRSAGLLVGGTGAAQLIGLGTLALVAFLYQPGDLGVAQAVISVLGLLGVVPMMSAGAWLAGAVALVVAVILTVIATAHGKFAGAYWVLAPATFLIGISQLVNALALRRRAFGHIARTRVEQSLMNAAGTAGLGILGTGAIGLVLAQVVQQVGGTVRLWRRTAREATPRRLWSHRPEMLPVLSANSHLLWGATGSGLVNNMAWAVPLLAIAFFYGPVEAGYFTLAAKCVSPVRALVTSTITQISIGEGGRHVATGDHAALRRQVLGFLKGTCLVGIAMVAAGLVGGHLAQVFVVGKWAGAVPYIIPLVVLVSMQLAISPLTSLPVLLGRQKEQFYFDLVRAVLVGGLFVFCGWTGVQARTAFTGHVVIMAATYAVYCRHFLSLLPPRTR
jgi:O-antigen/teichoic acid export membrane protein